MARFPAWVGRDGHPLSWAHFWVGMGSLYRDRTREVLRTARAVRIGQNPEENWERWERMQTIAGE